LPVLDGSGAPIKDEKGGITGIVLVFRDNTERKQAEKNLRESEARFKTIYENAPVLIDAFDESGRCILWNNECQKIFGWTIEEIKAHGDALSLFYPDPDVREEVIRTITTDPEAHFREWHPVTKDGKVLDTMWANFSLPDGLTFNLGYDITDRKLAESKLKESEASLRDAQRIANIGSWSIDLSTGTVEMSDEMFNLIGLKDKNEALIVSNHEKFYTPESWQRFNEAVETTRNKGESYEIELKFSDINAKCRDAVARGEAIYGENNKIIGLKGTLQDITGRKQNEKEKKRLEKQLQQSQKMESIGNLAGGIAHDFNNLLFPIIGMSEMLLEDLPEDSLEYENAQEIFTAGRRAGDLVQQILAFSRQSEHKMTPVRVQNVLKEVLKLSRSTIPTNIEIQQNIQQNCGLVMADSTQIHQISMNLITNAFHAVEDKNGFINIELKEITLKDNELPDSALQPGQYVRLSVSDNGIGMSQNTVHNIFEPYFTTKEKGKGTGLGLAVVFGIVKEYGGDIKVYSEVGKGTTFNIYLPLMEKSSDRIVIDKVSETAVGTENILLVDDEVSVAKLESKMLSRLGYLVTVETKSIDALKAFRSNPDFYDLVISDMTMPDMTGDQLAKEILSTKPDIPIIICTGFSERINKKQAETIGVKGFLMKPVVKSEMAQMVRKVLDEVKKLD